MRDIPMRLTWSRLAADDTPGTVSPMHGVHLQHRARSVQRALFRLSSPCHRFVVVRCVLGAVVVQTTYRLLVIRLAPGVVVLILTATGTPTLVTAARKVRG